MWCCGWKEMHEWHANFPIGLENMVPNLDFDVYDPKEDKVVKKQFSDFAGKWLVLFFYPADFTFVCPTELKDLNKSLEDIHGANAEILVISTDTVFTHKRWVETEMLLKDFGIQMVSDRTAELSALFGVLSMETGNSERGTFIISPEGTIKSVEIVTEPIGRSANELVRKVNALEFVRSNPGNACPASWNVWQKVLKPGIDIAGKVGESLEK